MILYIVSCCRTVQGAAEELTGTGTARTAEPAAAAKGLLLSARITAGGGVRVRGEFCAEHIHPQTHRDTHASASLKSITRHTPSNLIALTREHFSTFPMFVPSLSW